MPNATARCGSEPEIASSAETLYRRLLRGAPDATVRHDAETFLRDRLSLAATRCPDLPAGPDARNPDSLVAWVANRTHQVGDAFRRYLRDRRLGAPRRYFRNRAHALYFLRAVAPTKLVDGAWLYGFAARWHDIRIRGLIDTWLEELGEGSAHHNHVVIYRRLLAEHGCDDDHAGLPPAYFLQGATQLALGHLGEHYMPEAIGYNLGYEQPPLHMLITQHELAELGIDARYFALHVTIDNAASGHAALAARAATESVPLLGDVGTFWRRVRTGFALSELGPGSTDVIEDFDIDAELIRILRAKASAGHGMHCDRARIGGRTINDWLRDPVAVPALLRAMEREGWIVRHADPQRSRFWRLVADDSGSMFGVFTRYERQVIHDWIRGTEAEAGTGAGVAARTSMTVADVGAEKPGNAPDLVLDTDEHALLDVLDKTRDRNDAMAVLVPLLAPHAHATPVGLLATRLFAHLIRGASLTHARAAARRR